MEYLKSLAGFFLAALRHGWILLAGVFLVLLAFGQVIGVVPVNDLHIPWPWVIAILTFLAAVRVYHELRIEMRDLRASFRRAEWEREFNEYREKIEPFTTGISKMFYRFVRKESSPTNEWEVLVDESGLPYSDDASPILAAFAQTVYPQGTAGKDPESLYKASDYANNDILAEYKAFHLARRGIQEYMQRCAVLRNASTEFTTFLDNEVRPNHHRKLKILAYLEVPLAKATRSATSIPDTEWYKLAMEWEAQGNKSDT